MNPEGAAPASLGFGAERHIEKSRSASDAHEKVEHLTCAVEALLMHANLSRAMRGRLAIPPRGFPPMASWSGLRLFHPILFRRRRDLYS